MGQRHQSFVYLRHNPVKSFYDSLGLEDKSKWRDKLKQYLNYEEQRKKDIEAFGDGGSATVAYHHQWMYGRSALHAALNLLEFSKMAASQGVYSSNPFHEDFYKYGRSNPKDTVELVTNIMSMFNDRQLSPYTRCAVEGFHLLNYDEPDMRENFSRFDNNDGVTILDPEKGKYCFINISEQDVTNTSASALPSMTPCSAQEYVEAYYPSTLTKGAVEHIKYHMTDSSKKWTQKDADNYLKTNAKVNSKFLKGSNHSRL